MTAPPAGTVVFGDVVDSRRDPGSTAWLRSLCADLEAAYPRDARLASFAFTQGDEIQGLLAPDANPFLGVLRGALRSDARTLRWAVVAGEVEPGTGPATERTGPAFLAAREAIGRAKAHRDGLIASPVTRGRTRCSPSWGRCCRRCWPISPRASARSRA